MNDIVQIRVDAAVRALGGYWSPLAGLARVLEELAELAAARGEDRRREAADCTVAVLALANQYCVPVAEMSVPQPAEGERQALISAGHLARMVNRFEGAKPPKPVEPGAPPLDAIVGDLIAGLASSVDMRVPDLMDQAAVVAEANAVRDARRFVARVDAVTSPLRDSFAREVADSARLAPTAGLWGAREPDAAVWRADVERFLRVDGVHPLAGLVLRQWHRHDQHDEVLRALAGIPDIASRLTTINVSEACYTVIEGRRGLPARS